MNEIWELESGSFFKKYDSEGKERDNNVDGKKQ